MYVCHLHGALSPKGQTCAEAWHSCHLIPQMSARGRSASSLEGEHFLVLDINIPKVVMGPLRKTG